MAYTVTPADVEARWRPLSAEEQSVAAVLIDDLLSDLDLLRPSLAEFYGDLDDPELTMVSKVIVRSVANAVKRALRNPDTYTSTNIGADGGIAVGYDNRIESLKATSAHLSRGELSMIDRAVAASGGPAYSSVNSVKLQAHSERIPPGNLSILPTA